MSNPNNQPDAMLARIRALLAKAEDEAATEPEAQAYTAKAMQLMGKYGIDQAMLGAADPSKDLLGDRVITVERPLAYERVLLLSALAEELRVKAIYVPFAQYGEYTKHHVNLFGFASDLDRLEILFTSLILQGARFLGQATIPPGMNQTVWKRNWMAGFIYSVKTRLHEAEAYAAKQQQDRTDTRTGLSVELVLVDRQMLVDRAVAAAYPTLKTNKRPGRNGPGVGVGLEDGRRADLGGTRVGGDRTKAVAGQ